MGDSDSLIFDQRVSAWAGCACRDWGLPEPADEFFTKLKQRLPQGLLSTINLGIDAGIVICTGRTFTLRGLSAHKGPYNWFGRLPAIQSINANWEYFVQVAEFVRLARAFSGTGYRLTFEDDWMDIGVYRDSRLLVCCEVKEKSSQASRLLAGLKSHEAFIDRDARENDPKRKAMYITKHRPEYFYLVAIGTRREFSVSYPATKAFELREDVIPFI